MSYDPTKHLVDQLLPRGDGSGMNKAFEIQVDQIQITVSVQASRYCRSTFARIDGSMMNSSYPMWIGMDSGDSGEFDKSLWTPVEFEVAVYLTRKSTMMKLFLDLSAFRDEFVGRTPPALYAEDDDFGETGVANFVPLRKVEALMMSLLIESSSHPPVGHQPPRDEYKDEQCIRS